MIALVAIAVTAVGWLSYRSLEQAILPRVLDRIETHSRLVAFDLESHVSGARGDIAGFQSAAALNGLIRAHFAGGIDPVDGLSERTWRERIAERLLAELKAKPTYAQFRIIGIEDGGREIIRVDRSGPNGTVRLVPATELQRKDERPYFKDTIGLPANEVYVSPLDLNQENGVVETPYVPTLRIAAPLYASDGKPFGIVIVNVDMRPAFDRVRSSVRQGGSIYVVDSRGDYLVHPDRSREFGSDLGTQIDWRKDFPSLVPLLGDHAKRRGDGAGSNRKAGRRGARSRPSGRQGMGRGHRNRAERRHHGACHDDPEHLAAGRLDRGAGRGGTGATDRAIADASDRAADRGSRRHHARRRGSHSGQCGRRDRRAGAGVCPDGCGIDREDARTAARGRGTSPHRSRP